MMKDLTAKKLLVNCKNIRSVNKKAFPLTQCGRSGDNRSGLRRRLVIHSKVRQYKYKLGKEFKWKEGHNQHIKTVDNSPQYKCYDCGDKFKKKSSLSRHIRTFHKNEKPFVCDKSSRTFTSEEMLQYHLTNVECTKKV